MPHAFLKTVEVKVQAVRVTLSERAQAHIANKGGASRRGPCLRVNLIGAVYGGVS